MKAIYCTESQDRIPFEYFAQGKAIWSGGKPYLTTNAMQLGLKPDAQPPQGFMESSPDADGKKMGPPPVKLNAPKAQSSVDLSPIPSSNVAMAEFQVPKGGVVAPPTASTVMGPGVSGDDQPLISPPPIYLKKGNTGRVPPPPPEDEDKLDATVPEVNISEKKVLVSPLEAPTLMPGETAAAMGRPVSNPQTPAIKPPPPAEDHEKTPVPAAAASAASVPTPTPDSTPAAIDPKVADLSSQIVKIKAEIKSFETRVAEEQAKVDPAQQAVNDLQRKMLVDTETAEATSAQNKASVAQEAAQRKRIDELLAIEADAKAKLDAAVKERTELEEKARASSVQRAKADIEIKQRKQAENRFKADLETRKKLLAEAEVGLNAAIKERDAATERLKAAELELVKAEKDAAERKAAEEKAARKRAEEVARAKKEAEEKARKEAEARAKKEAEEKAQKEAEELAKAEAELAAKLEAIKQQRKAAEERAKK